VCTPFDKAGPWDYKVYTSAYCVGGVVNKIYAQQDDTLAGLLVKYGADMTAVLNACEPSPYIITVPSCPAPPRGAGLDYEPPDVNEVRVVPAGPCYEYLSGTPTPYDDSHAFRIVPPYCAPNGHLLLGDLVGTSYEPIMCAYRPEPKDLGFPACGLAAGNPINIATGNKFQREDDYVGTGPLPLRLTRYYNSLDIGHEGAPFGIGWRHEYQRFVEYYGDGGQPLALAYRADGKVLTFRQNGTAFAADTDVMARLAQDTSGWTFTDENDAVEKYSSSGRLISITNRAGASVTMNYDTQGRLSSASDAFGRQLAFGYDGRGRISTVTDPSGRTYLYEYNANNAIAGVNYPDSTSRIYYYNEQAYTNFTDLPYALTGIVDENGERYASFRYNSAGQVVSSAHVSNGSEVNIFTVAYGTQSSTVTDPLGTNRVHTFQTIAGSSKSTGMSKPCNTCGVSASSISLDATTGQPTSKIDFRYVETTYQRNASNGRTDLETQRTEAAFTSDARTIKTTWHPNFRLPATVVEPAAGGSKTTTLTYDTSGNLLQKQIVAPKNDGTGGTITRSWSWTYTTFGRVLTVTDPTNRVTTYTYYPDSDSDVGRRGNLQTITNPVGHVTQLTSYAASGLPLTVVDPNGLTTNLQYDLRDHLTSRTVGGESTSYVYDGVGQLLTLTLPDASTLNYTYDTAHRLTEIRDGLGNRIAYTLDAAGNRRQESVYDTSGALARTRSAVYDELNRLSQSIGALNQTTAYIYDGNGNRTSITDPLNHTTTNTYDAFNRLTAVLDPGNARVQYDYDTANNLTRVTDPRGIATAYTYDGLGNRIRLDSPDTGTTTSSYDLAGNLTSQTDALGNTVTLTLDAINRVAIRKHSRAGNPDETQTFTYDSGANGKGHLAQLADPVATTSWTYTIQGRVASKTQVVGTVSRTIGLTYNGAGQIATLTTPSGQQVTYTYVNNRPAAVRVNGTLLVGGIVAAPFASLAAWQWGNGLYTFRDYDRDGRLSSWSFRNGATIVRNDLTFDGASRITGIADPIQSTLSGAYDYDLTDRLILAQQGSPVTLTRQYGYDAVGNRTSTSLNGAVSTLAYGQTNNQLVSISGAPPSGYLAGAADVSLVYNNAHRLTQVQSSGMPLASYSVNGLGQRVMKVGGGVTTIFVFDEQGRLLGEYDGVGNLIQETVWLEDLPVATLRPNGSGTPTPIAIYYVQADHLGAPRVVTRPSDNAFMWRWDNIDPFGANPSNDNPAGQGTFKYALRLPGQYLDEEIGMNYNYFRDYDPAIGRYGESDPIGIRGGSNTYIYASNNPGASIDPRGLITWKGTAIVAGANKFFGRAFGKYDLESECLRGTKWKVNVVASGWVAALTPITVTGGLTPIEFQDGLDWINPYVFTGDWLSYGASFATPFLGVSWGATWLGGAYASFGKSDYYGWDFTIVSSIIGTSHVLSAEPLCCGPCP